MKKAFVTGGTGFIGSHLVEELLRREWTDVRCLIRTERKWLAELPVTEIQGNLSDDALVADAVRDVDIVFHNAGVTRATDWETFERANVEATVRLLEQIERVNPSVERVVVTSSLAAIGRCSDGVATEETPLRPLTRYGRSKAEMECAIAPFMDRLPIVIVRPPSVYGPREADIFTFFQTVDKRICPVVGSVNEPVVSLVYVTDLVRGMVDAAVSSETAGETYFLGSETFFSWNDVKHAATDALGHGALTIAVPPMLVGTVGAIVEAASRVTGGYPPLNREKAREIRYACKMCSIDKASRDFGYAAPTPLNKGVQETIRWYREEGWL